MEITEVRIKLMEDNSGSNERLQAFCSITFDDMFVIRDLKIIEVRRASSVAMPSAQADRSMPQLRHQEPPAEPVLQPVRMPAGREPRSPPRCGRPGQTARRHRPPHQLDVPGEDPVGRAGLYADELERAKMPGYISRYDEYEVDDLEFPYNSHSPWPRGPESSTASSRRGTHPACARQPVGASWTARSASAGQPGTGNRLGLSPSRRVHVVRQWHLNPALRTEKARAAD